ncbi:MAG: hypothetical protein ACK5Y2_05080 [Bdellovibrionales bacterium]
MLKDRALLQYLHDYIHGTLGVQYLARPLGGEPGPQTPPVLVESRTAVELIFVNYDRRDQSLSADAQQVFEKMIKALGYESEQVWTLQGESLEFSEILRRLRTLQLQAPVIVLREAPQITETPQTTGPHSWIECFSISEMMEKTQLKKVSWKVLQLFKKGSPT